MWKRCFILLRMFMTICGGSCSVEHRSPFQPWSQFRRDMQPHAENAEIRYRFQCFEEICPPHVDLRWGVKKFFRSLRSRLSPTFKTVAPPLPGTHFLYLSLSPATLFIFAYPSLLSLFPLF